MYLVINKWVIAVNVSNFSGQYLRNHWTLDIGVLGYIGIVWPKEHSSEVWSVPPVTPCILACGQLYVRAAVSPVPTTQQARGTAQAVWSLCRRQNSFPCRFPVVSSLRLVTTVTELLIAVVLAFTIPYRLWHRVVVEQALCSSSGTAVRISSHRPWE